MSDNHPEETEVLIFIAINPDNGDTHGVGTVDGKILRFGAIANEHMQGFETREEAEAALKSYGVPGHIVPLVLRPADGSYPPGWPT
jgi:hypothetical protein